MKDALTTFFQALPKKVKIALHIFELLLCFYAATSIVLHYTVLGPYVDKYLEVVAVGFLLLFPLLHVIVQFAFGVEVKPPGADLTDAVGDKMTDALVNMLDRANTTITVTTKNDAPPDVPNP